MVSVSSVGVSGWLVWQERGGWLLELQENENSGLEHGIKLFFVGFELHICRHLIPLELS